MEGKPRPVCTVVFPLTQNGSNVFLTESEARLIASEWHGGQASALYAFASSGYPTTHYTPRPTSHNTTIAENYHELLREIAREADYMRERAEARDTLDNDTSDAQSIRRG